jgi:hypothetical protein
MLYQMDLLSVTDGAVRELEKWFDVILRNKLSAQDLLVDYWLPSHREHLFSRPEELFGMSVTIDTPLHVHIGRFPGKRHLVQTSVASFAAHSLIHVNAVIEIDEVGQIIDAIPAYGLVLAQTGAHRFQHLAVSPKLLMTVHACRCGRHPGKRTHFNRVVAVPAVNADPGHVMCMAKRHWLVEWYPFASDVRGVHHSGPPPSRDCDCENAPEYRQARNRIGRSLEYLGHRSHYVQRPQTKHAPYQHKHLRFGKISGGKEPTRRQPIAMMAEPADHSAWTVRREGYPRFPENSP